MDLRERHRYELKLGSRGDAVRAVKELLNFNPRNPYRDDGGDHFDAKLARCVAEFQRVACLRNTGGTIDVETWKALGRNELNVRLRLLAHGDATLHGLLRGTMTGVTRTLTAGEISLSKEVFKDSIDYSLVKVHNFRYIPGQPDNVLMTPDGEIYSPGGNYNNDYSAVADFDLKSSFIHEMAHVWQWQNTVVHVRTAAFLEAVSHWGEYSEAYKYTLAEGKGVKDYGIEQQAAIIQDYYRVVLRGSSFSKFAGGKYAGQERIQNGGLIQARKNLLIKVMGDFVVNPNY